MSLLSLFAIKVIDHQTQQYQPQFQFYRNSTMENVLQSQQWQSFQKKAQSIDKIAERALLREDKKIHQKYSNIENTVKILRNLITQFSKKADKLQKKLTANARIQQSKYKNNYYLSRISQCVGLSDKLKQKIQQKSKITEQTSKQLNKIKRQLIIIKTQNIKKIMAIQELENKQKIEEKKENVETKKQSLKNKQEQQRLMITTKNLFIPHKNLKQECNQLQIKLFQKIDETQSLQFLISSSYQLLKKKLCEHEKKSNLYGMSGSLLFKLSQRNESQMKVPESRRTKDLINCIKKSDSKLIIYDVLKAKYHKTIKEQRKKQQIFDVPFEQFMKFNPMQILGIIELRGGLGTIKNKTLSSYPSNERCQNSNQQISVEQEALQKQIIEFDQKYQRLRS